MLRVIVLLFAMLAGIAIVAVAFLGVLAAAPPVDRPTPGERSGADARMGLRVGSGVVGRSAGEELGDHLHLR